MKVELEERVGGYTHRSVQNVSKFSALHWFQTTPICNEGIEDESLFFCISVQILQWSRLTDCELQTETNSHNCVFNVQWWHKNSKRIIFTFRMKWGLVSFHIVCTWNAFVLVICSHSKTNYMGSLFLSISANNLIATA